MGIDIEIKKKRMTMKDIEDGYLQAEFLKEIPNGIEKDNDENSDLFDVKSMKLLKTKPTGRKIQDISTYLGPEEEYTEPVSEEEKSLMTLKKYFHEGRILESIIYAIEPDREKGIINFITDFDSVNRIVIPDTLFFYKDAFRKDMKYADSHEQFKRKYNMSCTMIGARVSFVIVQFQEQIEKGKTYYNVVGSRVAASELMKDYYFFDDEGPRVQVGDMVSPRILSTSRVWVKTEVFGVECSMNMPMLSATHWIKDCTKEFKVGQKIDAIVTQVTIDRETRKVKLNLSRKYLTKKYTEKTDLSKIEIGTIIMGEVVYYNAEKGIATAVLRGDILCSIPMFRFIGGKRLYPGDQISAIIAEIHPKEGYVVASAKPLLIKYER